MIEHANLARTQDSFSTVARPYAEWVGTGLDRVESPPDRGMVGAFAEYVLAAAGGGPVGDLGCGPGRLTAHLTGLGLDVFGVDLAPGMIDVARELHPGLRFSVGSLLDLDLPDGALAGAAAWYSIHYTPPESMPRLFAELARVLAPGGWLLTGWHVGDEAHELRDFGGHEVSLTSWRLPTSRVTAWCEAAGFEIRALLERAAATEVGEKSPQASLLARKH